MASAKDVVWDQLESANFLIEKFTEDLTDAEYFQPPMDGANHAAWILGHLACSEDWTVSLITGKAQRLAQSWHDRFRAGSTCVPDATEYPSRKEIDERYRNTRAVMVEALKTFDESRWAEPSPDAAPRDFCPTLGSLWGMEASHEFWHIGQLAACRRALHKKTVLF